LGRWLAAIALTTVATAGPASATTPPADATAPGTVVSSTVLAQNLWLPNTGKAYHVSYRTTGWDNQPTVETGAVFLPVGTPPPGGWKVISWEHGTTGVASGCAPTLIGRSQRDIDYLSAMLQAGYAIVASDYESLGTPGIHPYLDGLSLAYSGIDMVRAARHVSSSLSAHWMAFGHSEGGLAALWTGSLASRYAPELDFRGTVSTAPASQAHETFSVIPITPTAVMNAFWFYFMAGFQVTTPTFNPADYLTPAGLSLYAQTLTSTTTCFPNLQSYITANNLTYQDLTTLTTAKVNQLADILSAIGEIPVAKYTEPVFIAQGTADTTVFPPSTQTTASQLAAAGTDVTFKSYTGATHDTVLTVALPDILAFAAQRFA
jgi:alpha-beta hydrolase superfamily lysophospholipase